MNIMQRESQRRRSVIGTISILLLSSLRWTSAAAENPVPTPGAMIFGPVADSPVAKDAIILQPGEDIEAIVRGHPPGTRYFLKPGLYRTQQIFPKDGDSFTGAKGAILNGARQLTTFEVWRGVYVVHNQVPHPMAERVGECLPQFPRCDRPQDFYFDGRPLRAVSRISELRPGTWYFDYDHNDVYFHDAPDHHAIELSYTPFAFGGGARNVMISNLIVENYASADQQAAINNHGAGTGWKVMNNEVRWNHGYGIVVGTANQILDNNIHHNGEMGLGGGSGTHDGLVKGNVIAFNSWNGTNCAWECGGGKWGNVTRLRNEGDGLWTDETSSAIVFEGNLIENNRRAGISHEISHAAVIRNNLLRGNGASTHVWGWQAQIQIQNATDTEVYDNIIVLDPQKGGNGITVIQQSRGSQFKPRNIFIHDNDITMTGGEGVVAGWFAEAETGAFDASNRFDHNHYHVADPATRRVWAANAFDIFPVWQAAGGDPNGTVDTLIATRPCSADRVPNENHCSRSTESTLPDRSRLSETPPR
jgi:parallel beta-helix repeat protein